jgi:hypothetical protein
MEDKPGVFDKDGRYYPPGSQMHDRKGFGKPFKFLAIATVIALFVSVPFILFFTFTNPNLIIDPVYVDTYFVEADTNATDLDINIISISGDVEVETDNSLDHDIEIETRVYSTDENSMHYMMYEWDISQTGDIYAMEFLYTDYSAFDDGRLVFDHQILINPKFNLSRLNIDATTGDIDIGLASNPEVNLLNLETTTGSVDFKYVDGIMNSDILITTTTGGVNLVLNSLEIYGDILVDVTTSGADFYFTDLLFMQDTRIDVDVTTGSIDFEWSQLTSLNHTLDIFLDTTTGSINGELEIRSDISLNFDADVTTGGTDVPNDRTGSAGTMNFFLESTTGSIDISL